jgi:hypothetical protein
MQPKTKDTNTHLALPHRRKHRVRKGLAEVLGVLGLRPGEEAEVQNHKPSRPPPSRSISTQSSSALRSTGSVASKPFITVSPAVDEYSDTQSTLSTEPDMAILDNFRKPSFKGIHSHRTSSVPPQKQDAAALSVSKRLPVASSKVEADRMSVNSSPTTLVSDTSTIEDEDAKRAQKSKSRSRNITPSTASQQDQILIVQDVFSSLETKLREELKSSKDEWLADGMSIETFLGYIGGERLRRMPPRGSRWDKILKWAEYFASSLSFFEESVEGYMASSKETVELVFGCLRVLLQVRAPLL